MRIRRGSIGDYWVHVAFIRLYRYWSVSALKIEMLTKWGTLAAQRCFCRVCERHNGVHGRTLGGQWSVDGFRDPSPPSFTLLTSSSPRFVHPRNEISETPIKLLRVEELTPLVTQLSSVAQSFFEPATPLLTLGTSQISWLRSITVVKAHKIVYVMRISFLQVFRLRKKCKKLIIFSLSAILAHER